MNTKNNFNSDIFINSFPNILENENLREPQINAYVETYNHFIRDEKRSHALIVLPTGVGKTGVMGLVPYYISRGRVLVIAPRVAIKDSLVKNLDPLNPENFWVKRKVFPSPEYLPNVCEYNPILTRDVLDKSNIIILNAQKLQTRLDSSILNYLPTDYFDLIIIDEAHHSTAKTWVDAVEHFSQAKVIKLTGTPFRTDGQEIEGELVYNYKLGLAMAKNYVKSLENISYIPDELYLTIDDEDKTYSIEEIYQLGLKDEDWVARSVAFSNECSEKVVDRSIEFLQRKRESSNIPHKIIAVACSIKHAEQIKLIYESKDLKVAIIHSKLEEKDKDKAFLDIDNNRVDVVVNVAMLGEGYDHPYLSVAAIFRPFKAELPYIQFIGRILRFIHDDGATPTDNIGHIISHTNLELDGLWGKYKKEIEESEIIKRLIDNLDIDDLWDDDQDDRDIDSNGKVLQFGKAYEYGVGTIVGDSFVDTELLKKAREAELEEKQKITELIKLLDITEQQARIIYRSSNADLSYKRPDKMYLNTKQGLDTKIRAEIVPELITEFGIDKDAKNLETLSYFSDPKYKWITSKAKDNAALLAIFFNQFLKVEMGLAREEWSQGDYEIAYKKLDTVVEYVKKMLIKY